MNNKVELYEDKLSVLNKKIPLSEKIHFIHRVLKDRLDCIDRIAAVLYDSKSDLLKTFVHSSDEDDPLVRYQARLSDVKSLKAIMESGQARVVNDLSVFEGGKAEHTKKILAQGFGSSYTQPIYLNGQFLGFVFFDSYQKQSFRQEVLQELNFFGHLISSLISTEVATIRMMLATVQAARQISAYHHLETGLHIDRVSYYARLIAQELAPKYGFSDEFVEHIFLFSPLHDIGKIGVPDAVLKKNEKLTKEEFEELKKHVVIGGQIIDSISKDFGFDTRQQITMLRNLAEYHHEAVDGSGYCLGLQGEGIPIEARIIAVADIFDALTSTRCYKVAWSNEEAFTMLEELAGFKLDNDCVKALVQNRDKIIEIQEGFKEKRHKSKIGKRKFPRINMEIKGDFRILRPEKDKTLHSIKVKMIGRGGLMFISPVPLSMGTPLQVRLFPFSNVITLNSKVVWTEAIGGKNASGFKIGLQFDPFYQASLLLIDFLLQARQE